MRKVYHLIIIAIFAILFAGCGSGVTISKITTGEYYPKFYKQQPVSILVLPARNTTTAVNATEHFRNTITRPLSEKGYYVFPANLVDSFFKSENLSDASLIRNIPVKKLQEIFNADAILYVDINAWDTGYSVLSSHVDVGLSFSLVDAHSGDEIWQNNAYAYSYNGTDGNNGIVGLIVSAIAVALNTATDYTELAYVANLYGTVRMPHGKYHQRFKKDINDPLYFYDNTKLKDNRLYINEYFIFGNKKEGDIALTTRMYAKGYHAFSVSSFDSFNHNGYANYYVTQDINGKKYLRNRFFKYEDNKPYLLYEDKKVFVVTDNSGKIPYSVDDGSYYFTIDNIVELSKK